MSDVEPMYAESTLEFPYKRSTGETVGRFLAGLRDTKTIWGQRAAGVGVVVPPHGYSETDGSPTTEWVAVEPTGTVTAVALVHQPIADLHPFDAPFAYVLVRLGGADTALAHVVTERPGDVTVGARVEAVWKPDGERTGSIRDIESFRLIG